MNGGASRRAEIPGGFSARRVVRLARWPFPLQPPASLVRYRASQPPIIPQAEAPPMLNFHSKKPVRLCDGLTRRDFLRVGSLSAGAVGVSLADLSGVRAGAPSEGVNCILLFQVGGPSQLDTWDPKPNAPSTIRGPFTPMRTTVPGLDLCE